MCYVLLLYICLPLPLNHYSELLLAISSGSLGRLNGCVPPHKGTVSHTETHKNLNWHTSVYPEARDPTFSSSYVQPISFLVLVYFFSDYCSVQYPRIHTFQFSLSWCIFISVQMSISAFPYPTVVRLLQTKSITLNASSNHILPFFSLPCKWTHHQTWWCMTLRVYVCELRCVLYVWKIERKWDWRLCQNVHAISSDCGTG